MMSVREKILLVIILIMVKHVDIVLDNTVNGIDIRSANPTLAFIFAIIVLLFLLPQNAWQHLRPKNAQSSALEEDLLDDEEDGE